MYAGKVESLPLSSTTNLGYVHEGGLSPDVPRKGVSNYRVHNIHMKPNTK